MTRPADDPYRPASNPPMLDDMAITAQDRVAADTSHRTFWKIGPNWFAAVMGTGIVAVAGAQLPVRIPGLHTASLAVWVLAAVLLVALAAGWVVSGYRERGEDPVMAQFWGAPAMAMLTVGAGTLLLGKDLIGLRAAVDADWVLWVAGTVFGLVTAVGVPYLMMTRHEIAADAAFGGWLMPVVPPMVSAACGAALVPHLPPGQARLSMWLACYAMFGISLILSLILITHLHHRLITHKTLPAVMVPTLWIVLGPLGQSVTASGNLANVAGEVLHGPYPAGAAVVALLYGVPTWGFAMLWLVLAAAVTVRTVRQGMPFAPTWWAFTFPVGTCVTGTISLAARTHSIALRDISVGLFVLLVLAWAVVGARSLFASRMFSVMK
jgi:C4-dicarboxylate transporter/malic acid transport protein